MGRKMGGGRKVDIDKIDEGRKERKGGEIRSDKSTRSIMERERGGGREEREEKGREKGRKREGKKVASILESGIN